MTATSTVGAPADRTPGAPTAHTINLSTALARLDKVWCRDTADDPAGEDRLGYYARGLEPLLGLVAADRQPNNPGLERLRTENNTLRRQLDDLVDLRRQFADARAHNTQLERTLAEAQQEADTWHSEYERVVGDQLVDVGEHAEAAEERDQARRELDRWAIALVDANQQLADARQQLLAKETGRTVETLTSLRRICGAFAAQLESLAAPPADSAAEQANAAPAAAAHVIGNCGDCQRPMLPQRLWKNRPDLHPGHVRVGGRGLCNSCYGNASRNGRLPQVGAS